MDDASPAPGRSHTPWRTHLLCYALLGGLFIYVIIARYLQPLVFEEAIGIEPARVAMVEQRIDPNTATWPELARLPGIGEIMAKRIVTFRTERADPQAESGRQVPVFKRLEDLEAIHGIGPQTLNRIGPYLKFPDP